MNRKELPVTVRDVQVALYKGASPSRGGRGRTWSSWTLSTVEARFARVDLPPGVSVTRMILLSPGRDDKLGGMEGVGRAESVANIFGARAVRKVVAAPWYILPSRT